MRGSCGITKPETKKDRYMFDAIEYYCTDIDWFAFQIVNLLLNTYTAIDIERVLVSSDPKMKKIANKFSHYEEYIMWFMVLVRVVMFIVMPYIRGDDKKMIHYTFKYWAPFYVIYGLIFFVAGNSVSDLSYSMIVVDTTMFLF